MSVWEYNASPVLDAWVAKMTARSYLKTPFRTVAGCGGRRQFSHWLRRLRLQVPAARVLPFFVLLGAAMTAAPGHAAPGQDYGRPSHFTQPAGVSVEHATSIVREKIGGRVLSAGPVQRHGERMVRVRLLVEGERVITVFVDDRGHIDSRRR